MEEDAIIIFEVKRSQPWEGETSIFLKKVITIYVFVDIFLIYAKCITFYDSFLCACNTDVSSTFTVRLERKN